MMTGARKKAIGIITGSRVDALEAVGLVVVERETLISIAGYLADVSQVLWEKARVVRKILGMSEMDS